MAVSATRIISIINRSDGPSSSSCGISVGEVGSSCGDVGLEMVVGVRTCEVDPMAVKDVSAPLLNITRLSSMVFSVWAWDVLAALVDSKVIFPTVKPPEKGLVEVILIELPLASMVKSLSSPV